METRDRKDGTPCGKTNDIRFFTERWVQTARAAMHIFQSRDMNVFAGNATLYILMAMVPFFTLAAGLVNFLPKTYLKDFSVMLASVFPNIPQIQSMVNTMISRVNPETGTVVVSISLLIMLWSASNGVSALQLGLTRISSDSPPSVIRRRLSAVIHTVLFIGLIAALLIFRVYRSSLSEFGSKLSDLFHQPQISVVFDTILKDGGLITSFAMGLIVLFAYTFLQSHIHRIQDLLPGTVFTTIFWILFSELFEWFISQFWNASALYGSFASVFLTAMWLKTIITILFVGASLNEALRLEKEDDKI